MAAKKPAKPEPTGTVAAHRAREAERQAAVNAERARLVKETRASNKATADRLDAKPTDSRKLVA